MMKKRRGIWRWFRRLLLTVAAAAVAGYVFSGWYLTPLVRRQLVEHVKEAHVSIERARFVGTGIRIEGLTIAEDMRSAAASPVFFAERLWVQFRPTELLRRRLVLRTAAVYDAVLTCDYEHGRGWNVQRLGIQPGDADDDGLSLVRLHRGALRIRHITNGTPQTITTIGLDGRVVNDTAGGMSFSVRADDRFALSGSALDGTLKPTDNGKHRLTLTGAVRMPQTTIFGNAWNMKDLQADGVVDAETLALEQLTFAMGAGEATLSGWANRDGFEARIELNNFMLSDTPQSDALVYQNLVEALPDNTLVGFLRRFVPRGRGDVDWTLRGRWDDVMAATIDGQVLCRDVSIQDERFPYRLEQMVGPISFSGRSLTLDNLTCIHGESEFAIEGNVENFGPQMDIWLRIVSGQLCFDEDIYRALGPEGKRLWFAFSPSGVGAVDHTFRRTADGVRTQRLAVELIDAGAVYEHFPYPLEHLTGRVIFESSQIQIQDVAADFPDGRTLRLDGTITDAERFSIGLRAAAIPVDKRLIRAMPPAQQDFLERFELDATATVDMRLFAEPTGRRPVDYTAHFEVVGPRMIYAGFPLPLEDVRIAADVSPDGIDLKRFTGRSGDGTIAFNGRIAAQGADERSVGLCLDVQAQQFELDERFWRVAQPMLVHLPEPLRLGGTVDVAGRWRYNLLETTCEPTDITVVCDRNPIVIDGDAAGRLSGRLQFGDERLRLNQVRIEGLELNATLAQVLPERLRQAYTTLAVAGRVEAEIAEATANITEAGFGGMDITGTLTLIDVQSDAEGGISELDGTLEGRLRLGDDERITHLAVRYAAEQFQMLGQSIQSLDGYAAFDPDTGLLSSDDVAIALADGSATGTATLDIQSREDFLAYTLDLVFGDIDVGRLAVGDRPKDNDAPPTERGSAHGTLSMQGRLGRPDSKQGKMDVVVSKMQLGRQSLIGKMLTTIQFSEPKDYVFNEMEISAFVAGDEVIFDRLRIVGRPFVFHGDGRMNLKTQRIEMDMVALGGLAGKEPFFLDSLLRGLGSVFWKIEVRGELAEPDIRTISLPILQLPLDLLRR